MKWQQLFDQAALGELDALLFVKTKHDISGFLKSPISSFEERFHSLLLLRFQDNP